MIKLYILVGAALVAAGLLPLIGGQWFLADLFSHFPVQGLSLAAVLFAVGPLTWRHWRRWRRWLWGVPIVAAAANGYWVLPLLPPIDGDPARPAATLGIMVANVNRVNQDTGRLTALLRRRRPDIAVVHEAGPNWRPAWAALRDIYPHQRLVGRIDGRGGALLSRHPIERVAVEELGTFRAPTIFAVLRWRGAPLRVAVTHPKPPWSAARFRARNQLFEQLAAWAAKAPAAPTVVAGDLNVTPYSGAFRRLLRRGGLAQARAGRGIYPSWPTFLPRALRIPIDHVLHNAAFRTISVELGPDIGSDHLPLIVRLAPVAR